MTAVAPEEALDLLTPEEERRLEAILDAPEPISFREFVDQVNPDYVWYRHCEVLAERLQEVADGGIRRLMCFMPPRHGKSEQVSRLFPAYYLYRFPHRFVGLNSYTAELAYDLSADARENYTRFGRDLSGDTSAKKQWETTDGGGLWAAGVGGSITGKGFHLGIIDDPIKNAEAASSESHRRKNRNWYDSTFYTRREPGNAIVVIQTRWHELDLAGWLIDRESDDPEGWHIIHLEGVRDELPDYPATCTVESDWRDPGEALCPERRSLEELKAFRQRNPYYFAALVQGKPRPREGGLFRRDFFHILGPSELPDGGTVCRYWDRAGTDEGGDYTVGVRGRFVEVAPEDTRFIIEDVVRGQWGPERREKRFSETIEIDGPGVAQWIEEEPGSSGKDAVRATAKRNPGYRIRGDKVTGSKEDRADPLASWGATAGVYLARGPWNRAFIEELTSFPHGANDDQVDAASGVFNKLTKAAKVSTRISRW